MNKVKIMCIMLMAIVLNGCGGVIDSSTLNAYEKLCEPNGGIQEYWVMISTHVICNNGAEFDFLDIETNAIKEVKPK